jgi:hypothetical protein
MPEISYLSAALISILVKTSATKLKRTGDIGSPYLTPLPASKYSLLTSFILTPTDPLFNRDLISERKAGLKPL